MIVLSPLYAAVYFMGIFVGGATVAFYWIESGEFANAFTYGGRTFSMYPVSIYSGLFRRVFAYGLGFAQAEDDMPTLQLAVFTARGQLAALQGPSGVESDYLVALEDVWGTIGRRYARVYTDTEHAP